MNRAEKTPQDSIVLATRNPGKIRELNDMLAGFGLRVLGLADFPDIGEIEETGTTFQENAAIKARAVATATGLVALADDSGLVVDALGGAPGVYSARYSDPGATDARNNEKLLTALSGVPEEKRACRFVSVIVAMTPGGDSILAEGRWEGRVLNAPRGDNGFGYDPLFFDPELGKSAAELPREVKNGRSHRGRALRRLLEAWPGFWTRAARRA